MGTDSHGRVIHTGQAIVDLVMRIDAIPEPGGDTFARSHQLAAGGGINVMVAAARDGGDVVYAGGHGTGPFGDLVRAAMRREGVEVLSPAATDHDTGFCVALVDDSAERTFVSTVGAEGHAGIGDYQAAAVTEQDVVYVSGYSLVHADNRAALIHWLPRLPAATTVVVDPSPVIGEIDDEALRTVIARTTVWSTNEREARILADRLHVGSTATYDTDPMALAGDLATGLGCHVILRRGAQGAIVAQRAGDGAPVVVDVPALAVQAVDTNGAGDAHCGVLCAQLADGAGLVDAATRAGVAAALAVTREGPATSPTSAEIDRAVHGTAVG
ncbi:PfkB family carbohydrate kinase [Raineyella sp. LH-20]|uniref:PfkB family carbohydrate kinase n=1 Tax=Raineyella sp. LH-20 TaxID=3081204 RepID=UPI0029550E5F|nr:PfkB family carbohydrate kinase [Raineyella sp. LH-20]WOP19391.1 PfkB family carbohydrate kinase [Raineyella sp. LH-20]